MFEGLWQSTLVSIDLPQGEAALKDASAVQRARRRDLNAPMAYPIRFIRNRAGRIVLDRQANTAALLAHYYPSSKSAAVSGVMWSPDDPNELRVRLPGGGAVDTRVTRRSATSAGPQRLETSEFMRQAFEGPDGGIERIKASQCFTKYRWRSAVEAAGGPEVVATQVVSDYLTSYDGERAYLTAMGSPIVVYTYKMAFVRAGRAA